MTIFLKVHLSKVLLKKVRPITTKFNNETKKIKSENHLSNLPDKIDSTSMTSLRIVC